MKENFFTKLNAIDVSNYTSDKAGLTYLTWSSAWSELKKLYPDATYNIKKFENNLPYVYDENTGYMVFTDVTIDGLTHEMWLPVMNGSNKAMKSKPYQYKTKYANKSVEAATMFDINKTIMRCLVKNLAMFGLGLYIYAGEDLPEEARDNEVVKNDEEITNEKMIKKIKTFDDALEVVKKGGKKLSKCTKEELQNILNELEEGEK